MTPHQVQVMAHEIAPCLGTGPLAGHAQALVDAAASLGSGPGAADAKARVVCRLFDGMEAAFALDDDPLPALLGVLASATEHLGTLRIAPRDEDEAPGDGPDVTTVTGEHYGQLFRQFSTVSYFDEPSTLLHARLQRNNIDSAKWSRRQVLDAGCGGGRYTVAWRMLGARGVTGIDVSATGIADARRRVNEAHINAVHFDQGDVLALPYEDHRFGVVFSNGVLHHTVNWHAGVAELVRVLAPGGLGWLYLIENPGGYFWDVIEILRVLMRGTSRGAARDALAADGLPANRIFYMLDHVMAPINIRLTAAAVEGALRDSGAVSIRRLTRGADFDRVEAIHRGDRFARDKYGVGEHRYVFTKA